MSREQLFEKRTPAIRDLALAACALIQHLVPNAIETVDKSYQTMTYGASQKGMEELCYVAAFNHDGIPEGRERFK